MNDATTVAVLSAALAAAYGLVILNRISLRRPIQRIKCAHFKEHTRCHICNR